MMKIKYTALALLSAAVLSSCSLLGSLDDLEFEYVRTDDNIITDATSAESQLAGVYTQWKHFNVSTFFTLQSMRSGTIQTVNIAGYTEFRTNQITDTNDATEKFYTNLYLIINSANSFIASLNARPEVTGLSPERRKEMLGEAYFNKALAEYYLLCTFGEFYDMESEYGIVIWNEPVRKTEARKRSSVADSYQTILDDLEAAMQAPAAPAVGHAGLYAAQALKAKVLLCMQRYPEAAEVAGALIEANDSALESDFLAPFRNPYGSKEILFDLYCYYPNSSLGNQYNVYYSTPGQTLTELADELVGEVGDGVLSTPDYLSYYTWISEQAALDPSLEEAFVAYVNDLYYGMPYFSSIQSMYDEYLMYGMSDDDVKMVIGMDVQAYVETTGIETGIAPTECNAMGYDYRYIQTYDPVLREGESNMSKYIYGDYTSGPSNTIFFLRMADVYYVKAEAEARQGGSAHLDAARTALERVLERAQYGRDYIDAIPDEALVATIMKHRYMENFTENQDDYFDQVRAFMLDGKNFCNNSLVAAGRTLIAPVPRAAISGNGLLEQLPAKSNETNTKP